jgi:ComF family protein
MVRLIDQDQSAILIPVPLHRRRIWSRGYNQAALIAKLLAKETGLRFELDMLRRVKSTPMLKQMGPVARKKAVRSAFAVAKDRRAGVTGKAVILVDDVYTTGATANACARALKRAGAASVRLICWARVIPNREASVELAAMGSHLLEDALSHGH